MADISVRNLEDDIVDGLKLRAAASGRSMEAEVRAILTSAVSGRDEGRNLAQAFRERFAAIGGADLALPPRADVPRSPDFSGAP